MAASSGVAAVVQKIPCAYKYWNKIRRVESLQSLKQRLQGSSKLRINLDVESQGISFYPPAVKSEPPPPVHGAAEPQEPQTSNEKLQPTAAEMVNAPSRSAAFEKQPDASRKVQESAGVPDDGGGAAETKSETAETVNVESKEAEPLELMETSVPQSSAETKLLPTNTSDSPTTAPSTNPPQRPQTTFKTEETSVQPSPEVQKSPHSSDWAAQEPKTTTERSQEQQPPAADSDLVAQKSPSWKVDGKASPAAAEPEPSQPSAAAGSEATVDETTSSAPPVPAPQERTLDFQTIASRIAFSSMETILSEKFLSTDVCLVISNLPEFNDGCYTEADVVHLLRTFGFELEVSRVFVSPQHRMAFVLQPAVKKVQQFFRASNGQDLVLKGSKLQVQVASIQNTSFGFYTFLMSITGCQRKILPSSVVYIKNISSSEATDLKNALRKIGDVINYMPLLNKVFVEFKNPGDADRLGVWYSFLRRRLPHSVHRTGLPEGIKTAECPSLVAQALPDTSNIIARAHIPTTTTGVPEGSVAPFWITMTTSPYVFSTACPWFNIPEFITVSKMEHLTLVKQRMTFPVVMLTGLPTAAYTHTDLVKLVWNYFPEQNLHSLYCNVMVLPLQRRAFLCLNSWDDGFRFLQDHIRSPVCLKGCVLSAHFVLKNILPRSSEESMYRSLMQLSNIDVPDLKSLEDRLLCMEVSGTNRRLVSSVMVKVASVATFTSFLPLADRIYVEMAESSGVTKVLENLSLCKSSEQSAVWNQVGRVERLKNRKQRLRDMARIAVKLEPNTDDVCTTSTDERSPNKESPEPSCSAAAVSSAGSKVSEPAMEEQRQTEPTVDSAIAPETDVETAEEEKDESVSCSPVPSDEQEENLPEIDMEVSDESRSSSAGAADEDSPQNEALEDPEDVLCSKHDVEPDLILEDLVNEIGDDMKEKGSDYSSTSKQTPTEKREGQSSDVSSTESSPSLTTSSVSTSSSSEPNKPQTKPSSSVGGIETSPSFSSSESVETLRDESSSTGQTAAAERTPGQEDEHIESAVRTSDHKGSAESSAAESDESIIEKLSETGPEQTLELIHQTLKLETNDGTPKEEEDGKSTKENEDVNAQILDSLNENKDEQRNKKERHTSGPEKDQGGLLVSEGVNEVKTCSKTKTDDSVKVKDGAASNQQRVEDEGSTVKPDQTDRTQTEDRETGKDKKTDEIISVGDESVPKKISLRRSSRGAKNTQETTGDKETITTRTTRGGRTEQDSAERGEGETRRTPEALKDVTPTETAEDSSEPQRKIPEDFQETEKDKEAATSRKRGRPRKTRQTPVLNKQQLELSEPEAKRTRLQSPRIAADFKLPAFNPQTPLGQEFVSRKWGFYCNLCSVSYLNEDITEDKHCRSQTHCENLQKYKKHQELLQNLQKKPTRMSTRNSPKPR